MARSNAHNNVMDENYGSLLSKEDEMELLIRYKSGDKSALDILVEKNIALVKSIAKNYVGRGLEFDDLVQEGTFGLIDAIEKFDFEKNVRLSTYAGWKIRQMILRAIDNKSRSIRLTVAARQKISIINKAIIALTNKLMHEPSYEEISEFTGISVRRVAELVMSFQTDLAQGASNELIYNPVYYETYEDFYNVVLAQEVRKIVDVTDLSDRERMILDLRFGLVDGLYHTQEDIGGLMGCTKARIGQIERGALNKIRSMILAKNMCDGLSALIDLDSTNGYNLLLKQIM